MIRNPLPYDLGVVVPVREGSSRIKDKVLLPFDERLTLLRWLYDEAEPTTTAAYA